MTILVTGGAGFIGAHLVKKLIDLKHKAIVVDNFNDYYDPRLKEDRIKIFLKGYKFKIYRIDIADYKALEKVFKENQIDKIIHLAAQAGVMYSLTYPFVYIQSNVLGTLNLLELMKKYKLKHFIYASSSSVYGGNTKIPFSEKDKVDKPISIYAATKRATELLAYTYHHLYGINCIGLRFFNVYGTWARPDLALVKFVRRIMANQPIEVYNYGKMARDFTYIDDILDGVIKAMSKNFKCEIFNLGNSYPVKLTEYIKLIEKYLGKKAKQKMMPMQIGDVRKTWADISKAKKLLGYQPHIKIEEGVNRVIEWCKEYYKS